MGTGYFAKLVVATAALAVTASAAADPQFSSVIAFGDSLSDNGNYYRLVDTLTPLTPQDGSPPLPYFFGRYSNGPVAVEILSANLGVPLHDYAVGGALSGSANEDPRFPGSGVLGQVQDFVATHRSLDDDALYVVWGGANDFLGAANLDAPGVAPAVIATAIGNLTHSVGLLYAHGARHFLVPNMPDLGLTPLNHGQNAPGATYLSTIFNQAFAQTLQVLGGQLKHADIHTVDVAALLQSIVASQGSNQFANVTDACVNDQSYACILSSFNGGPFDSVTGEPIPGYLFWDDVHPTAFAHAMLAKQFAVAISSSGLGTPPQHADRKDWLERVRENHKP